MTEQQRELSKFIRNRNYTYKQISELTGIDKTRVFRILSCLNEMKLEEYLKVVSLYKNESGWTIDKAFFFLGVK
jgi:uncharacterized protein YerC